jgi:hypothetical protein
MLKGNRQLLEYYPLERRENSPAVDPLLRHVLDYCPFPDGKMNTARDGPTFVINAAVGFRPELINQTLDQLVGAGLSNEERWLLDIPRRVDDLFEE